MKISKSFWIMCALSITGSILIYYKEYGWLSIFMPIVGCATFFGFDYSSYRFTGEGMWLTENERQ